MEGVGGSVGKGPVIVAIVLTDKDEGRGVVHWPDLAHGVDIIVYIDLEGSVLLFLGAGNQDGIPLLLDLVGPLGGGSAVGGVGIDVLDKAVILRRVGEVKGGDADTGLDCFGADVVGLDQRIVDKFTLGGNVQLLEGILRTVAAAAKGAEV